MKSVLLFFGIALTAFCSDGQMREASLQGNGANAEMRMLHAAYLKERAVYERSYQVDPRATIDSVNQMRMQQGMVRAQQRLVAYESNDRIDTVKIIDLSYLGLEELPSFVLNATHLERLILDYNHIGDLPAGLKHLNKLNYLQWRANHLDDVWWIHIPRLKQLEQLDLSNNLLDRLPSGIKKLKGLHKLSLDENFFQAIPIGRLKKGKFIREVTFNQSHVLALGKAKYEKINFVEVLRVNHSHLTSIDASFYLLTGLKELYLQENELTRLPDGISRLLRLEKLSFYKNALTSLPLDFFDLDLKVIDLYHNQLEVIPNEIAKLHAIELLYLAYNRIYSLPESVGYLSNLKELYLHHNRLTVLPESLSGLKKLRVARVNDNYLIDFPTQFLNQKHLEDLDISNNQITRIPKDLESLKGLKLFSYQENPIHVDEIENAYLPPMIMRMERSGTTCVPSVYQEAFSRSDQSGGGD